MSRDDIVRMAQSVGLAFVYNERDEDGWVELERFAALVAAAECNECAKECKELLNEFVGTEENKHYCWGVEDCLETILKRNSQ